MTYWGGDQIVALADMPRDVDYAYTRANVIDGRFTYSSSTTKTRYTTALVSGLIRVTPMRMRWSQCSSSLWWPGTDLISWK